ncbi:EpsG family protein [Affinibrenneria salicis]|uniref:EpsG family protein n=1 Tax=Affinibrenneria salicis TaxID=2590031 RepID=A0A5J5FW20_9GAMM|nr:EpsG family protein [Affinibrenneria salicis]KAA8996980.1 EpsG family protein [Affinibrenneria salicis]
MLNPASHCGAAPADQLMAQAARWLLWSLAALAFYIAPYIATVVCVGLISAATILRRQSGNTLNAAAFALLTLAAVVPLASKNLEPIMNDKVNYYLEMQLGSGYSLLEWLQRFSGTDFLSHFLFKLSASLVGVNNAAFAVVFIVSFSVLAIGVYRLSRRWFVAILFLFCCQYNFQGLYGNLLRQGLALSFLVLAVSCRRRRDMLLWIILASLSHFSACLFLPWLLLPQRMKNVNTLTALGIFALCYLAGSMLMPKLLAVVGNDFLATRAEAYVSGDYGNDPARKIMVTLLYIGVVECLFIFSRLRLRAASPDFSRTAGAVRLMFLYNCAIFFTTRSFAEVSNRYSFNMMIFVLIYMVLVCGQLRDDVSRTLLAILCFSLGVASYLYINQIGVQQFWFGDLQSLLTDSLPTVLSKLGIAGDAAAI